MFEELSSIKNNYFTILFSNCHRDLILLEAKNKLLLFIYRIIFYNLLK